MEADGNGHRGPSGSSKVTRWRLLLIHARRLTVEDELSIASVHRTAGGHGSVKAAKVQQKSRGWNVETATQF